MLIMLVLIIKSNEKKSNNKFITQWRQKKTNKIILYKNKQVTSFFSISVRARNFRLNIIMNLG